LPHFQGIYEFGESTLEQTFRNTLMAVMSKKNAWKILATVCIQIPV